VTPIPRWGRLCFRARKDQRDRMKEAATLAALLQRLWFHRNVADAAIEVGAVPGAHDLEAIRDKLNGWRVAVVLRQARPAGLVADRAAQGFVPLVFHGDRLSKPPELLRSETVPIRGAGPFSHARFQKPPGRVLRTAKCKADATRRLNKYERGRQPRRPSVTSQVAQCPVRAASRCAARLVRPLAI
jgi:hypothetical protein